MKIKHFSGYGCVNAYVANDLKYYDLNGHRVHEIWISVRGNHERGLERDDYFDKFMLCDWLLKRFKRGITYDKVIGITHHDYYVGDEEHCDYIFDIKN